MKGKYRQIYFENKKLTSLILYISPYFTPNQLRSNRYVFYQLLVHRFTATQLYYVYSNKIKPVDDNTSHVKELQSDF